MGLPQNYTFPATGKKDSLGTIEKEDRRCSLVGNSFLVPVVARLLAEPLFAWGFLDHLPTVDMCWGRLVQQQEEQVLQKLNLGGRGYIHKTNCEAVRHLFRHAIFKGSDVRLATGTLRDPRGWPRQGIEARRWLWKTVIAYPKGGRHINYLELLAILRSIQWRMRAARGVHLKFAHLSDSQVCMGVLVKGRSSSLQLSSVLKQINALVLASSSSPFYTFVRSADNPADTPSRWFDKLQQ